MTLQFGASLTDDTRSVNYDRNTFIIQATGEREKMTMITVVLAGLSKYKLGSTYQVPTKREVKDFHFFLLEKLNF